MTGCVGEKYLQSPAKRRLDLLGGLAVAVAVLPAGVIAATAACIDKQSLNPFFKQMRVGHSGEPLQILKFQTLNSTATSGPRQAFGTYDHRASKIGLGLRKYALDELPQLGQVIAGNMSLVGLRPELPETIEKLEAIAPDVFPRWYSAYTAAKPALTGPSQIYRRSQARLTDTVFHHSMILDLQYAASASLATDLDILAKTPLKLLRVRANDGEQLVSDATFVPVEGHVQNLDS